MPLTTDQVNEMLKAKGFNQAKLARRYRRHKSSINRAIKNTRTCTKLRKNIAAFIGVPVEMLPDLSAGKEQQ